VFLWESAVDEFVISDELPRRESILVSRAESDTASATRTDADAYRTATAPARHRGPHTSPASSLTTFARPPSEASSDEHCLALLGKTSRAGRGRLWAAPARAGWSRDTGDAAKPDSDPLIPSVTEIEVE